MRALGTLGWTDVDVGVGAGPAERFWHYLSGGKRCPSLQAPPPCPCVCEKRKLKCTALIEPHFKCGRGHIESLPARSPLKSPAQSQGSPVLLGKQGWNPPFPPRTPGGAADSRREAGCSRADLEDNLGGLVWRSLRSGWFLLDTRRPLHGREGPRHSRANSRCVTNARLQLGEEGPPRGDFRIEGGIPGCAQAKSVRISTA